MQKKLLMNILILILIIISLVTCLTIGYKIGSNGDAPEIIWKKNIDVKTIAVVNLDEGVLVDEKLVNYSKELIDYTNGYLVNTSLEDAREGITDGRFAAYVIIPADFSENVYSINDSPIESQIQYALCNNLSSQSGLEAMSNVYILINSLNDKVSYMYVDSILDEFHWVQDGADEILENDKTAQSVINNLTGEDISAHVELPVETPMDYSPGSIDYSSYLDNNSILITDINNIYETDYLKSQNEKDELLSAAGTLKNNLSETNNRIKDINIELDEEGNYVYDAELTNLKTSLNTYNEELETSIGRLIDAADETDGVVKRSEKGIDNVTQCYSDTIDKYNEDLSVDLSTMASTISNGVYQLKITSDKCTNTQENNIVVPGSVDIEYSQNDIRTYILTGVDGNIDTNVLYSLLSDVASNGLVTYTVNINGTMKDVTNVSELTDTIPGMDKNVCYKKDENDVYSRQNKKITTQLNDVKQGLTELQTVIDDIDSSAHGIDTDVVVQDVKENVVDKLSENAESITGMITSEYGNGVTSLSLFDEKLALYDPFSYIDQNAINEKRTQLENSTGTLQTAIQAKDSDDMEQMNTIYDQYSENISNLKTSITDAVQSSNQSLEEGLEETKETLNTNSKRNQELLTEFGEKLPYTRNGSLGNYRAYQFIVNPCEGTNLSQQIEESEPIVKTNDGITESQEKQMIYAIVGITILMMLASFVATFIYKKRTKKNYNL